ncbi:serine/threonine-protein kinase 31-like isoform X6 [Haemaphysalis longicornis]
MAKKRETFNVCVNNLPANVTEQSLTPLFTEVGEVCDVRIRSCKRDQASKVAYVRYYFEVDADEAVSKRNGYLFGNHRLDVRRMSKPDRHETPEEKPGDAGGGSMGAPPEEAPPDARGATAGERGDQVSRPPPNQPYNNPELQLLVTYVRDTTCFYGQRLSDKGQIAEIGMKLATFCPSAPPEMSPEYHTVYAAQYSGDGEWYRCEVRKKLSNSTSLVEYIDYGNAEEVKHGPGLVKLAGELAKMPGKALFIRLDGLQSIRRDDDPVFYDKALSEVQGMIEDQAVVVQTKSTASIQTATFVTSCRLLVSGRDVMEEVLQRGFAKKMQPNHSSRSGTRTPPTGEGAAHSLSVPEAAGRLCTPNWRGHRATTYDRGHQRGSGHAAGPDRGANPEDNAVLPFGSYGRGLLDSRCRPVMPPLGMRGVLTRAMGPPVFGAAPIRGPRANLVRDEPAPSAPGEMLVARMALEQGAQSLLGPGPVPPEASVAYIQLRDERNRLRAQLDTMEARIKVLEHEAAVAREAAQSSGSFPNMGEILALLAESQRQREQFSTDGVNADAVEMAVWMIKERRGDQVRPSRKVEDAINRYQQAQSAIIACRDEVKEQDKLQALMDARDAACENLLQELQTFQDSPDTAGSVNGLEHLQVPLAELRRVYGDLVDVQVDVSLEADAPAPTFNDLCSFLSFLKAEKIPEYQKMRRPTDAARTRLTACLQDLLKMLDQSSGSNITIKLEICKALDSGKLKAGSEESPFTSLEESGANAGSLASLEMSARQLLASVRAEISACHMLSSPDGRVLAMLVPQAARELQRLIEEASKVSTVHDCYRGLLRDIAQDGPECTSSYADRLAKEVLQLRSAARKLKSAVRHRLADLEDIESCDEDEVAQVQSDVNALRAKLHGILVEEEKLMDKLADLQHRRFPELAVMHPSLELAQYKRYHGLLKLHWEPALFDTVRSFGLLKTTFLQEAFWISEYALDGPDSLEDLMTKVCKYSSHQNPRLLPVRAVFISKDQRQASLMVPGKGLPLAGGTHAVLPRWHVLLQVLEALHHLHSAAGSQPALVHGRVHPASVMVSEDGHSAWLSLPDFNTYSLGKAYMLPPADQVDFVAPELRICTSLPTPASDMFAFGCLMLWLLFPGTMLTQGSLTALGTATPEAERCNRKELPLIRSLVAKDPRERPTAAGLLAHPIFQWCVEVQPPLKAKQAEPDSSEKMAKQAAALEEPAASEAAPEAAAEGPSASEATAEGPSAPEAAAEGPSAPRQPLRGPLPLRQLLRGPLPLRQPPRSPLLLLRVCKALLLLSEI